MTKHLLPILFALVVPGCALDDPKPSSSTTTSSTSQSLYGDPVCWDIFGDPIYDSGFDDFGLELDCDSYEDPTGGGGGGGGDAGSCWFPTTYTESAIARGQQSSATQQARSSALSAAQRDCQTSAYLCTPHVGGFNVTNGGCVHVDNEYPPDGSVIEIYSCSATAAVTCTYTFH